MRKRNRPERQREVVEHDEDFRGRDLVKVSDRRERLAAAVHVSCRFDQESLRSSPRPRPISPSNPTAAAAFGGESIEHHEADIVARLLIFAAGISETGDQANRRDFFVHNRSGARARKLLLRFLLFRRSRRASPSSFFAVITSGAAASFDRSRPVLLPRSERGPRTPSDPAGRVSSRLRAT